MEDSITIQLKRDDEGIISLVASPQFNDDGGGMISNGVYDLKCESLADIGQLAFHLDDKHQWEYCGEILSDDEVEQIVKTIQKVLV